MLKTGSRCVITYFLLNDESTRLIDAGAIRKALRHRREHCRFEDENVPERTVAVEETWVREMYGRHRCRMVHIYYGQWCGRKGPETRQDRVVAVKE